MRLELEKHTKRFAGENYYFSIVDPDGKKRMFNVAVSYGLLCKQTTSIFLDDKEVATINEVNILPRMQDILSNLATCILGSFVAVGKFKFCSHGHQAATCPYCHPEIILERLG